MTVLLSDGKGKLNDILRRIVDVFLTDAHCARGIFIKPNIVFPVKARSGEITSPLVLTALISALRERRSDVDIVIGEGVAAGCDPQENFQVSGYSDLARQLGVPLLDLHAVERTALAWQFGTLQLPCVALERTYINLPILKPSSACVISGALKNQKGLLLPNVKKRFHCLGLHKQIAELNAVVKPALTILDGSQFFGPRTFLSGDNCGEIDATACSLLEIEEPEHVRLAREARVFVPGYAVINGTFHAKPSAARLKSRESKQLGKLRLWSNSRACTMCRYLFREIKHDALRPGHITAKLKLAGYSIAGAEIVMGSRPSWRKEYGTVVCIGNCTRRVAKEHGAIYVPGCPPTLEDLYEGIRNDNHLNRAEE